MLLIQLKVQDQGRLLVWRPGQAGPWREVVGGRINHGGLTVRFLNGSGRVTVKTFRGSQERPLHRQAISRDGIYHLGAKSVERV